MHGDGGTHAELVYHHLAKISFVLAWIGDTSFLAREYALIILKYIVEIRALALRSFPFDAVVLTPDRVQAVSHEHVLIFHFLHNIMMHSPDMPEGDALTQWITLLPIGA
jgi:hypothetical protein